MRYRSIRRLLSAILALVVVAGMGRQLRFPYPGAVYHMMARGDGGKQLLLGKDDHGSFLHWLEQVCGSHGWRVHAWVIMGEHLPEVERIIRLTAGRVGLPAAAADLAKLRKGDPGKVAGAALVRLRTAMPNDWIAARLAMGGSTKSAHPNPQSSSLWQPPNDWWPSSGR